MVNYLFFHFQVTNSNLNYIKPSERTFLTNDIVTQENSEPGQSLDLQILSKNRVKYPTNPLIGYLNINSLRNKIIDVREVIGKMSLDYLVIS